MQNKWLNGLGAVLTLGVAIIAGNASADIIVNKDPTLTGAYVPSGPLSFGFPNVYDTFNTSETFDVTSLGIWIFEDPSQGLFATMVDLEIVDAVTNTTVWHQQFDMTGQFQGNGVSLLSFAFSSFALTSGQYYLGAYAPDANQPLLGWVNAGSAQDAALGTPPYFRDSTTGDISAYSADASAMAFIIEGTPVDVDQVNEPTVMALFIFAGGLLVRIRNKR